ELREKTRLAVHGRWNEPVFGALARVVSECKIPEQNLMEHLEGFAMDVEERHYGTLEDTLSYCYHVAGVVGVMMAMIMGVRDSETLDRASDLGIAFQITNIARDVMDDVALGRVYLPAQWLREEGFDVPISPIPCIATRSMPSRTDCLRWPTSSTCLRGMALLPCRSAPPGRLRLRGSFIAILAASSGRKDRPPGTAGRMSAVPASCSASRAALRQLRARMGMAALRLSRPGRGCGRGRAQRLPPSKSLI
ncbi:MAG TPA: squalene/phytoene synthase family protein, partial [Hyphomicrobiales bacterium]|nr:squalene/phytoene synthase family protein [Hyphomicrobiales bacterium]